MSWKLEYRKRFYHDLAALPPSVRIQIEEVVRKPIEDPFLLKSLKKLKGNTDKYRLRLGEYRVGLTIDRKERRIIFERCGPRKDIYKNWP